MNITGMGMVSIGGLVLALALGCSPRKPVTEHDRKEAAFLVSEAEFAMTMREWSRAEGLMAKAVTLIPAGDYWLSLGAVRLRLGNRAEAKAAYEAAVKAYREESARNNLSSEPWIKQAYVLALLGRRDDSKALAAKAAKVFPNDVKVRALTDAKEFERMVSSQKFKDMAL
jgi:tetratricopeptide (TPR) repeat protein